MEKHILVYGAGRSGIGAADLCARLVAATFLYDENAELDAKELASYLSREGAQAKACRDTMEAVRLSMMDLRESSVICAFGSLYQLAEYERCLLLFAANLQSGSGSSCLHE